MKIWINVLVMSSMAVLLSGCFGDGVEKCDNDSVKGTVKEILLENGVKVLIENQARKSIDEEKVRVLLAKEIKKARFGLLEAHIQEEIENYNEGIDKKNESIEAENRYSEVKKPLIKPIDGRPIMADLEKYKAIIDAFEPINSSDSFTKYFEAKVLSQNPLFALNMGYIKRGWVTPNMNDNDKLHWFKAYYIGGNEFTKVDNFIYDERQKIIKELSAKEVERITKSLDIVNIRELALDSKVKMRQCEASVKLNDNVSEKIFKYSVRQQDDGGYLVEVKFR